MNRDNLSCYEENNVLLKKNLKSINNIKGVFNNINQDYFSYFYYYKRKMEYKRHL